MAVFVLFAIFALLAVIAAAAQPLETWQRRRDRRIHWGDRVVPRRRSS